MRIPVGPFRERAIHTPGGSPTAPRKKKTKDAVNRRTRYTGKGDDNAHFARSVHSRYRNWRTGNDFGMRRRRRFVCAANQFATAAVGAAAAGATAAGATAVRVLHRSCRNTVQDRHD